MIKLTPIRCQKPPKGCYPVNFRHTEIVHIEHCMPEIETICRQLWTYLGYTGMGSLWVDDARSNAILAKNQDKIKRFFWHMDNFDIDWRSYCYLTLPLVPYTSWQRVLLLVNNAKHWHWAVKLREHVGTSEAFDELADFVLDFMQMQIEKYGTAKINTSSSVQRVPGMKNKGAYRSKYYAVYTLLADRIKQLKERDIDPKVWLDVKFEKSTIFDFVYLSTIANYNGLDPDVTELRAIVNDDWRTIRGFIGLSRECKFPDGCIPAGWWPASEDPNNIHDISVVTKDGFYRYSDGEQRRGKFHYMKNRYHVIACNPENFEQFKDSWRDVRRLTSRPTWQEYSQFAIYPDKWDERGKSLVERMPNIRWRAQ